MPAYILPDDQSSLLIGFDQTASENHTAVATVTKHPIEKGSDVADHVRTDPETLTLEVFVSNTPITTLDGRGAVTVVELPRPRLVAPRLTTPGAVFNAVSQGLDSLLTPQAPARAQVLRFGSSFDRVREIHEALLDLWVRAQTSTVITSKRTYENMVLVQVGLPITEPGGASFSLAFEQIKIVVSATVQAPKPAEKRGAPTQKKGSQSTQEVKDKDAEKSTSLAVKALDALGGVFK